MDEERFYTITQAAKLTLTKPHVLRYWEKEFRWLAPRKNSAGRRIYSQRDIELVKLIDRLIHKEGYSIAGARKRLAALMSLSAQTQLPLCRVEERVIELVKSELREIQNMLKQRLT